MFWQKCEVNRQDNTYTFKTKNKTYTTEEVVEFLQNSANVPNMYDGDLCLSQIIENDSYDMTPVFVIAWLTRYADSLAISVWKTTFESVLAKTGSDKTAYKEADAAKTKYYRTIYSVK